MLRLSGSIEKIMCDSFMVRLGAVDYNFKSMVCDRYCVVITGDFMDYGLKTEISISNG